MEKIAIIIGSDSDLPIDVILKAGCYNNNKKSTGDLHEKTNKFMRAKQKKFIQQKIRNFTLWNIKMTLQHLTD